MYIYLAVSYFSSNNHEFNKCSLSIYILIMSHKLRLKYLATYKCLCLIKYTKIYIQLRLIDKKNLTID